MTAQKFQVKLYVDAPKALDLDALVPVFHGFIREKKLGELVIDVADYEHVHHGPGIVLIGYGSDYYLDLGDGRPGLRYSRKRGFEGDEEAAFTDAVRRALGAAALLEAESSLGGVRFTLGDVQVRLNDRAVASNDESSFARFAPLYQRVLAKALGPDVVVTQTGDARDLLTVQVKGGRGSVNDALARLSA